MNEVEKMYSNAHVYPRVYGDITKETFENKVFNMADMCNEAFTAEKQLLLLQWLLDKTDLYLHRHKNDFTYSIATGDVAVNKYKYFEESIAELINAMWQSLTKEERKQIKNILELEIRE